MLKESLLLTLCPSVQTPLKCTPEISAGSSGRGGDRGQAHLGHGVTEDAGKGLHTGEMSQIFFFQLSNSC